MNNKKYELTNFTMGFEGRTLYRIRALKNFSDVKAGDLGGWVQSVKNLSQEGNCWIYDEAMCMDRARVCDDCAMRDFSAMFGNSRMHDNAVMVDDTMAFDCSTMWDNSIMFGSSKRYDNSVMRGDSKMHDCSTISGHSEMLGDSELCGDSELKEEEKLFGKLVSKVDKFIDVNNSKGRMVTGVLKNGKILYNVGCQNEITKEIFVSRIYNEDGEIKEHPYRKEYLKIIDMIELYFK